MERSVSLIKERIVDLRLKIIKTDGNDIWDKYQRYQLKDLLDFNEGLLESLLAPDERGYLQ